MSASDQLLEVVKVMDHLGLWRFYLSSSEYERVAHALDAADQGEDTASARLRSLLSPNSLSLGSDQWKERAYASLLVEERNAWEERPHLTHFRESSAKDEGSDASALPVHSSQMSFKADDSGIGPVQPHDASAAHTDMMPIDGKGSGTSVAEFNSSHDVNGGHLPHQGGYAGQTSGKHGGVSKELLHFRMRSLLSDFIVAVLFARREDSNSREWLSRASGSVWAQPDFPPGALEGLLEELAMYSEGSHDHDDAVDDIADSDASPSHVSTFSKQPPAYRPSIYSTLDHDAVILEAGLKNSKEFMPRHQILHQLLFLRTDAPNTDKQESTEIHDIGVATLNQPAQREPPPGLPAPQSDDLPFQPHATPHQDSSQSNALAKSDDGRVSSGTKDQDSHPAKRRRLPDETMRSKDAARPKEEKEDEDDVEPVVTRRKLRHKTPETATEERSHVKRVLSEEQVPFGPPRELRQLLSGSNDDRAAARAAMTKEARLLYEKLEKVLNQLMENDDHAWPFLKPVRKQDVPDYYEVIKKPMDFQTMNRKLQMHEYPHKAAFREDLQTIWTNCRLYNSSPIHAIRKHVDYMERLSNRLLDKVASQPPAEMYEFAVTQDSDHDDTASTTTRSAKHGGRSSTGTTRHHGSRQAADVKSRDGDNADNDKTAAVVSEAESETMSTRSTRRQTHTQPPVAKIDTPSKRTSTTVPSETESESSMKSRSRGRTRQTLQPADGANEPKTEMGDEADSEKYGLRTGKRRNYSADNLGRPNGENAKPPPSPTSQHPGTTPPGKRGGGAAGPLRGGARIRGRGRGGRPPMTVFKPRVEGPRLPGPTIAEQLAQVAGPEHELAVVDGDPVVACCARSLESNATRANRLLSMGDRFYRSLPLSDYPSIDDVQGHVQDPCLQPGAKAIPAVPSLDELIPSLQRADTSMTSHSLHTIARASGDRNGPQSPQSALGSAKSSSSFFTVSAPPRRVVGARNANQIGESGQPTSSRVLHRLSHLVTLERAKGRDGWHLGMGEFSELGEPGAVEPLPRPHHTGHVTPGSDADPLGMLSGVDTSESPARRSSSDSQAPRTRVDSVVARMSMKRAAASAALRLGAESADAMGLDILAHVATDLVQLTGQQLASHCHSDEVDTPSMSALKAVKMVFGETVLSNANDFMGKIDDTSSKFRAREDSTRDTSRFEPYYSTLPKK